MEFFKKIKKTARDKVTTLILGGFGLVAALAWNDAIQALFNAYFPKGAGLAGKFAYALGVTFILVLIASQLASESEKK